MRSAPERQHGHRVAQRKHQRPASEAGIKNSIATAFHTERHTSGGAASGAASGGTSTTVALEIGARQSGQPLASFSSQLSRQARQKMCAHGVITGALTSSMHIGHSSSAPAATSSVSLSTSSCCAAAGSAAPAAVWLEGGSGGVGGSVVTSAEESQIWRSLHPLHAWSGSATGRPGEWLQPGHR